MKLIFSRKGFDSQSGGVPSPIVDGVPTSLPIPTAKRTSTTYDDLRLGDVVEKVTRGRLAGADHCHCDPMFENGRCAFGQTGAAQSHLRNSGVAKGDVFLFFGLFAQDGRDMHHRIFAYLRVDELHHLGATPTANQHPKGFTIAHPHTIGEWNANNCLYVGRGRKAKRANDRLRLSKPGERVSIWRVPPWLQRAGLTYHRRPDQWREDGTLHVVAKGQEFVTDITGIAEASRWVRSILAVIDGERTQQC